MPARTPITVNLSTSLISRGQCTKRIRIHFEAFISHNRISAYIISILLRFQTFCSPIYSPLAICLLLLHPPIIFFINLSFYANLEFPYLSSSSWQRARALTLSMKEKVQRLNSPLISTRDKTLFRCFLTSPRRRRTLQRHVNQLNGISNKICDTVSLKILPKLRIDGKELLIIEEKNWTFVVYVKFFVIYFIFFWKIGKTENSNLNPNFQPFECCENKVWG